MADRVFAGVLLAIAIAYAAIAFTAIGAPIQYDPLGPETWPRLLGVAAALCCGWILLRPDVARFDATARTLGRLGAVVAMLALYAFAYEPLGFIPATFVFCTAFALFLGGRIGPVLVFAATTAVAGYFVCTGLLELNLPAGVLDALT